MFIYEFAPWKEIGASGRSFLLIPVAGDEDGAILFIMARDNQFGDKSYGE